MSYVNLEYGFMMDENTKEVYRIIDNTMHPSTPEEYQRLLDYNNKRSTLWSDATRVDKIPDDVLLDDDTNIYFSTDESCVSIYREQQDPEPYIAMICIQDLEDLSYSGLSGRGKAATLKLLGLVKDYIVDGEWHNDIVDWNSKTYKVNYKITNDAVMVGVKKILRGVPVHSKKKASALLNF